MNVPTSDPRSGRVRAAVLVNHPAQHFADGYRALAAWPGLDPRVYFWDAVPDGRFEPGFGRHVRWQADLHSGYDWWSPPATDRPLWRAWSVFRRLRRHRPAVILTFGWASPVARLGIVYAILTGTPLLLYGDTNVLATATGRHVRLRRYLHRSLLRFAAGAIATGGLNREFYVSHGLAPARVHPGVHPTDVASCAAAPRRPDGPLAIGFAGKFIPAKGLPDLIHAAARLELDGGWELVLAGDGPMRPHIERLVAEVGLAHRVRFLGFRNTDEIPAALAAMDILVMPSHQEPRGLVAVEAMAAGAAVVVSSATGVWGPDDVLRHGDSGLVYLAGDVEALARCLRTLMEDPPLRRRLAAHGQASVRACGPRDFAATTAAALLALAGRSACVPSS